jgi:small conductance mechanosensitive channel
VLREAVAIMIADFFANSSIGGWEAVLAVVVAVAGWIAASFAKKGTLRLLHRMPGITEGAASLVARLVRYALLLLTLGIVLTVLGAPLQPVLAAVILISLVGLLALRGIAANFGAGLVIQARRVVHIEDEIEVLGYMGVVKELNGRSVIIHTSDGRSVRLPNAAVLDNPLVNLTERDLYRSEIEVRTQSERQYGEIRDLIVAALDATDRVRSVPHPQALVALRAPTETTFRVRFWHDPHHRGEVRSAAVCSLVDALAEENIPAIVDWKIPLQPRTEPPPW